MTVKNPLLEKVFLALRPNFFPGYNREHITLKYYNSIRWETLLEHGARLEKQLPATIEPEGYHRWQAFGKGQWYEGLLVSNKGGTILDHLNMPHITLPKDSHYPIGANLEPQIVDTLWLGKSINKQYLWVKLTNRQIEVNYGSFGIPPSQQFTPITGREELSR